MATVTLLRERLEVQHDAGELQKLYSFDDLAKAAAEQLGYKALQVELSHLQRGEQECRSLKRAMIELNIEPFRKKDVEQYQANMVSHSSPRKARMLQSAVTASVVWLFLAFLNFIFWLGFTLGLKYIQLGQPPEWAMLAMVLPFIGSILCCLLATRGADKLAIAEWISIPLQDYGRPIPEFALQTAIDLKGRYTEAQFFVEELQLKEQQRTFDPFLVVKDPHRGEKYYLEVWNEPGFFQERQA